MCLRAAAKCALSGPEDLAQTRALQRFQRHLRVIDIAQNLLVLTILTKTVEALCRETAKPA